MEYQLLSPYSILDFKIAYVTLSYESKSDLHALLPKGGNYWLRIFLQTHQ